MFNFCGFCGSSMNVFSLNNKSHKSLQVKITEKGDVVPGNVIVFVEFNFKPAFSNVISQSA
jgi:hypothetical protein